MRKTNYSDLTALISSHFKPGVATNMFLPAAVVEREAEKGNIYTISDDSYLLIFRIHPSHFTMYYYLAPNAVPDFSLLHADTVCETAMREKDTALVSADKMLIDNGFERLFCRIRMKRAAETSDSTNTKIYTAGEDDFSTVRELLISSFSPLTGCIPSDDELHEAVENSEILLHSDGGLLHYRNSKASTELRHLCVSSESRGKGIGSDLVRTYLSLTKKKSTVWVRSDYAPAKKIYENNGYTPDGTTSSVLYLKK